MIYYYSRIHSKLIAFNSFVNLIMITIQIGQRGSSIIDLVWYNICRIYFRVIPKVLVRIYNKEFIKWQL